MAVIRDILLIVYVICVGFVGAGLLACIYQMVTSTAPQFRLTSRSLLMAPLDIVLIAFAGPLILLNNGIRGRLIYDRPFGWLVASSAISGFWSFCSGTVVLHLMFNI